MEPLLPVSVNTHRFGGGRPRMSGCPFRAPELMPCGDLWRLKKAVVTAVATRGRIGVC